MHLHELELHSFRCYEKRSFSFSNGLNIIYGENGIGKTALLEALYILSTGKSFRAPHLKETIRSGGNHFFLSIGFGEHKLSFGYEQGKKKIRFDDSPLENSADLIGKFPLTLLSPADASLIAGPPADRRRLLNIHLSQHDRPYLDALIRYNRALNQRNALLKQKTLLSLSAWESEMAHSGALLILKRQEATQELSKKTEELSIKLSDGKDIFSLRYIPSLIQTELGEKWEQSRSRDLLLGSTSLGPHRDEIEILMNGAPAKPLVSEGQKRTFSTALRLAEWHRLQKYSRAPPLFCIDDCGAHLDEKRLHLLQDHLTSFPQTVLTQAVKTEISPAFYLPL